MRVLIELRVIYGTDKDENVYEATAYVNETVIAQRTSKLSNADALGLLMMQISENLDEIELK